MNECALLHRIAGTYDHLLAHLETVGNLEFDPIVAARIHRLEVDTPDTGKYCGIHSLSFGLHLLLGSQRLEHGQYVPLDLTTSAASGTWAWPSCPCACASAACAWDTC